MSARLGRLARPVRRSRSGSRRVEYLFLCASFPHGAILSTGTGLVPELSFTLLPGDKVRIGIDGIGTLTNTVRLATADGFGWLTPEPGRAPR